MLYFFYLEEVQGEFGIGTLCGHRSAVMDLFAACGNVAAPFVDGGLHDLRGLAHVVKAHRPFFGKQAGITGIIGEGFGRDHGEAFAVFVFQDKGRLAAAVDDNVFGGDFLPEPVEEAVHDALRVAVRRRFVGRCVCGCRHGRIC